MLKRRTREHVIADLSVNHVERFIFRCGWTVERTAHDYGIDLVMDSYSAVGEPVSGRVYLQLKATDRLKLRKNDTIALRLDSRDVLAWLNEPMPVILILYDAIADAAYWVHIRSYFAGRRSDWRTQATVTVYLPKANVVDETAIRTFDVFRAKIVALFERVRLYEEQD